MNKENSSTVFLLESDVDDAVLLSEVVLECKAPIHLKHFLTGEEMFHELKRVEFPALVILAVRLPKRDGLYWLRQLKEDEDLSALPVVLYSGIIDAEVEAKGKSVGALTVLQKPIDGEGFTKLVDTICSLASPKSLEEV